MGTHLRIHHPDSYPVSNAFCNYNWQSHCHKQVRRCAAVLYKISQILQYNDCNREEKTGFLTVVCLPSNWFPRSSRSGSSHRLIIQVMEGPQNPRS
jgi:hypothetical protein